MNWYFQLPEGVPEVNAIKVHLYYEIGGMNYFHGTVNKRGYYVSIMPIKLAEYSETMSLFGKTSGGKVLLEETSRFNAKRFSQLEPLAQTKVDEFAELFMSKIGATHASV
jgi:hypothetical protein